jgi:hypothetical protein
LCAAAALGGFIDGTTTNVGFDGSERGDADKGLGGDRRRRLHLDILELPPHVAAFGKVRVGAIAVELPDAAEACERLGWPRMFAIGGIDRGNAWRSAAGPGPLVARIGPQLALLDAPATGIAYWGRSGPCAFLGGKVAGSCVMHAPNFAAKKSRVNCIRILINTAAQARDRIPAC